VHISSASELFGFHDNAASALAETPEGKRHAYELLAKDTPCSLFGDIEFEVLMDARHETDPDHGRLVLFLTDLRSILKEAYGIDPIFVVLIGSRPTDGGMFKYSYHVIVTNIVLPNNHDGVMKALMKLCMGTAEDDEAKEASLYYWYDANKGEYKSIIDLSVYSSNRHMRLWGCSKRGSTVPFLKLTDIRYIDIFDCTPFTDAWPTVEELA
jgi:hypothetical protein